MWCDRHVFWHGNECGRCVWFVMCDFETNVQIACTDSLGKCDRVNDICILLGCVFKRVWNTW